MYRRLACLGLLVLLSSCGGSAPSHFYTLAPVPPGAPDVPSRVGTGPAIVIAEVTLPPALDRDSFVTQSGPEQLDVSSENRWAAPLRGMVQRVLAADLASRMPSADVIAPGDPLPPGRVITIEANLREFIGNTDGRVTLDADWTMHGSHAIHRVSLTRQATSGHAGPIAAAMSSLLAELSDRIAAEIGRQPAARPE